MKPLRVRDLPILFFKNECNKIDLEKTILDCGAGGIRPPLALFYNDGYKTAGIEILDSQIERAITYEKENKMELNIIKGDMRKLPYEDNSFNFVFSFHTIFHMNKKDVEIAMKEMERVLAPGGLIFIDFPPYESIGYGIGEEVRPGEFVQTEGGEEILHSYYTDDEADAYFTNFDIKIKRKWQLLKCDSWVDGVGMLEYIAQKK